MTSNGVKIGVIFTMRKVNGGAYQYALTMLDALKELSHEFVIFNFSPDLPKEYSQLPNFEVLNLAESTPSLTLPTRGREHMKTIPSPRWGGIKGGVKFKIIIHKILLKLRLFYLLRFFTKLSQKNILNQIKSKNLDLMIFTMSHKLAILVDIPVIVPIHDLQHRLNPQFPEVSSGNIWNEREYLYSSIAKRAAKILVDSKIGSEDVANIYGVDPKKIEILPFLPPNYLTEQISSEQTNSFCGQYHLPERFLFYPAQLWPHKNHINLVKAMGILKTQGLIVELVLTGSNKEQWNTYDAMMKEADTLGVKKQIHYLGFVSNEAISILYQEAVALVMPTFFGPTNIPVLEAWKLRCPVLYSDIRGCREQAGDAALLFDPNNPESISDKIKTIWENESVRKDLIAKGHKRLNLWTPDQFKNKINAIIKQLEGAKA